MNQSIKNIIFILLIVGTLVAVFVISLNTQRDNPVEAPVDELFEYSIEEKPFEYKACLKDGGEWIRFSNACANFCGKPASCPFTVTYGCDCDDNKCWDTDNKKCTSL